MNPVPPLQAAIGAAIVNIGNVAVAFSAFGASTATAIESAVIGLVSVAFIAANELRHHTIATTTPPAAPVAAAPASK